MSDTTAIIAICLTVGSIVLFAASLLTRDWQNGTLKADIKWVRLYIRIYLDSKKTITTN